MELVQVISKVDDWFSVKLTSLNCSADARAYIIGVLSKYSSTKYVELSSNSIVLAYCNARKDGHFESFQRVGDWALWKSTFQQNESEQDVVELMGRLSYYTCHRLMRRTWPVYEELADELPAIVHNVRHNLFVE